MPPKKHAKRKGSPRSVASSRSATDEQRVASPLASDDSKEETSFTLESVAIDDATTSQSTTATEAPIERQGDVSQESPPSTVSSLPISPKHKAKKRRKKASYMDDVKQTEGTDNLEEGNDENLKKIESSSLQDEVEEDSQGVKEEVVIAQLIFCMHFAINHPFYPSICLPNLPIMITSEAHSRHNPSEFQVTKPGSVDNCLQRKRKKQKLFVSPGCTPGKLSAEVAQGNKCVSTQNDEKSLAHGENFRA